MDKSLVEFITDYLSSTELQLPVFHSVALRLQQVAARDDYTLEEVMKTLAADQALVSKVLKVANSPFYSGLSTVSTIGEAIVRLGGREVANLAMLASQQDYYRSDNDLLNRYMRILWSHSLGCAMGTKWLAERIGFRNLAQEAFLGGLLHDIGKLFLLKVLDELDRSRTIEVRFTEALVREVFDSLHPQQGFVLMQKWNLPEAYCRVVLDHHREEWDLDQVLTTLVRLANLTCRKAGVGMRHEPNLVLFTTREAQFLGVKEILLAELEIAIEDSVVRLS